VPAGGNYDAPVPVPDSRNLDRIEADAAAGPDLDAAIGRAQRGDEDAFRLIYRAVQPGLLRYLKALVGEDAEDVAAETWLRITRGLEGFRGDLDGFRAWAATIGRNRAMDHLRQQRRRPPGDLRGTAVDLLAERPAPDDTASAALETIATGSALAMIASLPRDQAEAVLLRVVMGLDANSAAQVLGKRSGAVRTAAYRGLRRLAAQLSAPPAPRSGQPPGRGVTDPGPSTLRDTR
jgi:RNA polymerase sigma-70 factor, ECF subfamily